MLTQTLQKSVTALDRMTSIWSEDKKNTIQSQTAENMSSIRHTNQKTHDVHVTKYYIIAINGN